MRRWAGMVCLLAGCSSAPRRLSVEAPVRILPADGFSTLTISVRPAEATLTVVEGGRRARVEALYAAGGRVDAVVRAGVLAGPAVVEARAAGYATARVPLTVVPGLSDAYGDGTPDCLRLTDERDRQAFIEWFTFLAEALYARDPATLPKEISDCAALLRFAYREALKEHDGAWARALALPAMINRPAVSKYQYPFTPLGAALFRVRPGPLRPGDVAGGAFAEFADARTLMERNAWLVTRDVRRALQGDLLFFRQLGQNLPFHAMIYCRPNVVYHTGSKDGMRRLPLEELLRYPNPQWRPAAGNRNFLGVYRWNILKLGD